MEIKLASVVAGSDFDDTQSTELQNTSDQTAHYDGWEEAFFQFVTVRHTSNFTIKQVTVMDGSLAGQQVILLKPVMPFRFMDMPPELRNKVYRYVAGSRRTHKLTQHGGRKERPGVKECRSAESNDFTFYVKHSTDFDILRVSKQILDEFAPVLYDSYTLEFDSVTRLSSFRNRSSTMFKHLTHVELGASFQIRRDGTCTISALADIGSLRSVKVHHVVLCRWRQAPLSHANDGMRRFAEYLSDRLLRPLQEIRGNRSWSVLEIVQIVTPTCQVCKLRLLDEMRYCLGKDECGISCKDDLLLDRHCEELNRGLRAQVAKKLGIEDNTTADVTNAVTNVSE